MKEITIQDAQMYTSPNPFALVSSCNDFGKTNLMAISWWTYASNSPATVVICISSKGYTHTLIDEGKEFALNIPNENLTDLAAKCGTCTGSDIDKAKAFGIELEPASSIRPMLVKESKVQMECRMVNKIPVGDHFLYVADVICIHGNENAKVLKSMNGYGYLRSY